MKSDKKRYIGKRDFSNIVENKMIKGGKDNWEVR